MLKKGHFNLGVKADTLTLSEQFFVIFVEESL